MYRLHLKKEGVSSQTDLHLVSLTNYFFQCMIRSAEFYLPMKIPLNLHRYYQLLCHLH